MKEDTIVKIIVGLMACLMLVLCVWAEHKWPDVKETLKLIENAALMALGGLGIYHAASNAGSRGSGQGGFISLRMLAVIVGMALGLAMLGGCTTTTGSIYRGYLTQAEAGVKTWDDNAITTLQKVLCAQPYSAIQRHPELQPGVLALCGPLASASSLDANQLTMLMGILKESGVRLQATPVPDK